MAEKRKRIGDILIEKGIISKEQFDEAFEESKRSNTKIGDALIQCGYATEEQIISCLSEQLGFAFIDVLHYQIDPISIALVPKELAERFQALPIYKIGSTLTVAMIDPLNIEAVDELEKATNLSINPVFGTSSGIEECIEKHYGQESSSVDADVGQQAADAMASGIAAGDPNITNVIEEATQAPVINLVQELIGEAVKRKASDIHLEPQGKGFFRRLRIDGVLDKPKPLPKELQNAAISRIKIMADIDISERRLPQDGRIQMSIDKKNVDLRVATFPTIHGEHVAIRVLDQTVGILSLDELGLQGDLLKSFQNIITKPHGLVLVTGPTGSGKSTTLYSALNSINDNKKNIITLEDPVEYSIDGVHQSQVNVKAGLTFAMGLRSIVRLDPDIIMIGEIRDRETAEIAIHAALTGHLVFSTLHTNDAPSACARLINIGVEPYLLASSLSAVLAQRLVRSIGEKSKKEYAPIAKELAKFKGSKAGTEELYNQIEAIAGGQHVDIDYQGRTGLYELLIPSDQIRQHIIQKSSAVEMKKAAQQEGMRSLMEDGLSKVIAGTTTLSEILRVTKEV